MKRPNYLRMMIAGIAMMMLAVFTSCGGDSVTDDDNTDWSKPADHTLLMYLVGDNTLKDMLQRNASDSQEILRDSVAAGKLNLVIMKDNHRDEGLPRLYWVHRNRAGGLDTVMIKQWQEDVNMASPELLAEVLKLTFTRFDTKIKGLSLGSHSSGWVPMGNNNKFAPQRRAFGQDDSITPFGSIELWDLGKVLTNGPKLDYILMDCCHMATIETLYELRNAARYVVASPTEVEGYGIICYQYDSGNKRYYNTIKALSDCQDAQDLPHALAIGMKQYQGYYDKKTTYGATISLIDLSYMDEIAACYKKLLEANTELLTQLRNEPDDANLLTQINELQHYGREEDGLHNRYYYFDMGNICDQLAAADAATAKELRQLMQKALVAECHSNIYRGITINSYSGVCVSIPEILHLADSYKRDPNAPLYIKSHFSPFTSDKLLRAYHRSAWGTYMGY